MRIVLDTNILLSALLSPEGPPAILLSAWERNQFALLACEALLGELREVSQRPFFRKHLRPSAAEVLISSIRELSLFVDPLAEEAVAPDPKDGFLLALADAGESDYLVTGDKALLKLKRHNRTRLATAAAMVEVLGPPV